MDVLTDWLKEIQTSAVVLSRSRLAPPWGIRMTARDGVMFHIVSEGACWLLRVNAPPQRLLQGDLILLPQGLDHDLVDEPGSQPEQLEVFLQRPPYPPGVKPTVTLLCGVYLAEPELAHPILNALPPVVVFSAASLRSKPALASTLALLTAELDKPEPGGEALMQHLFDALFVYVIRAWIEDSGSQCPGWFSALKDPFLSKVLAQIHSSPESQWTVESLAQACGLSRAAFARRFTEQVGEPPLTYLTRWRMGIAARLLQSTSASVTEVASKVGYESEFAFSRAFKRVRGIAPARFRHQPCTHR